MSQYFTVTSKNGRKASVRLEVNPKAKRLILRLDPKRREGVAIASSKRQSRAAMVFANEKADWIVSQLDRLPDSIPFQPGEIIPFRGMDITLDDQGAGRKAVFMELESLLSCPGASATFSDRVVRFLRRAAKDDLTEAVERHCRTLDVKASSISVKDTRSRWGSCSSDGKLSFSWRLVCAPPFVLDYVAAHEVAHLIEMNHSAAFWTLVDRCVPDMANARLWLKTNGAALHALGG